MSFYLRCMIRSPVNSRLAGVSAPTKAPLVIGNPDRLLLELRRFGFGVAYADPFV